MSLSRIIDRPQQIDTRLPARGFGLRVTPGGDFTIARTQPPRDASVSPLDGIYSRSVGFQDRDRETVYSERGRFEGMSISELSARLDLIGEQIQESHDELLENWSGSLALLFEKSNQDVGMTRTILWRSYWEVIDAIEQCKRATSAVNRAERGSKGLTSEGRRKVRSGLTLLEQRHGKKLLSFLTFTVPPMEFESLWRVCENWSEVVRQTVQNITRLQVSKGLDPDVCGVIEIQEDRFERTGQALPHIHLLVQGRKCHRDNWSSSPQEFEDCYRRAIEAVAGHPVDMRAACNTQGLKKSVARYLGNYMKKGNRNIERFRRWGDKLPLPKAWYTMSRSLLTEIKQKTRRVTIDGSFVQFAGWMSRFGGGVWHRDFALEETGATVAMFGAVAPKDVDRFVAYLVRCSESVPQTQNVLHELTG